MYENTYYLYKTNPVVFFFHFLDSLKGNLICAQQKLKISDFALWLRRGCQPFFVLPFQFAPKAAVTVAYLLVCPFLFVFVFPFHEYDRNCVFIIYNFNGYKFSSLIYTRNERNVDRKRSFFFFCSLSERKKKVVNHVKWCMKFLTYHILTLVSWHTLLSGLLVRNKETCTYI